jgi:RNA-directed DNA polymerase
LSPLLANLLLDDLDRELEARGVQFVRYADDCNIYVGSAKAANRVLASITRWLDRKLRLKVNAHKSAAAEATTRPFLGFQLRREVGSGQVARTIAPKSLCRIYDRLRGMTRRNCGRSIQRVVGEIAVYLRGWWGYYQHIDQYADVCALQSWLRRRLRQIHWRQWKNGHRRFSELQRLAPGYDQSWYAQGAIGKYGPWHMSLTPQLHTALPAKYWNELGLPKLDRPGWR